MDNHIIRCLQGCQVLSWLSGLGSPIFRINAMSRNHNLAPLYTKAINQCCNPECDGVLSPIEAHHILPVRYGGLDKYINLIALCRECHRKMPKHNCYERSLKTQETLLRWKFKAGYLIIGKCSDDVSNIKYGQLLNKSIKAKLQLIP